MSAGGQAPFVFDREVLARLSPGDRLAVLRALPEPELRAFHESWAIWAMPGQRAPDADWHVWLIRAGRGFGKTRAGAEWVAVFAVDWTDPTLRVDLGEGVIGAVELADGGFTAELRGVSAALDRAVVEETSPECRAELGDARCRVAMAGRRRFARVVGCDRQAVTLDQGEPSADAYGGGVVRWFGGANCGLESAIAWSGGAVVTLRGVPVFAVAPGVLVELVEGCDKSVATCAARFANAVNFRGEPYLPGIDLLTRYPGA